MVLTEQFADNVYFLIYTDNKKDRWDSGKPRRQHILFCNIQIKVVISRMQIYVYHIDLLPLKIPVTLSLTFQGHLRSNLIVPLDSPYMVAYVS